MKLTDLYSEAFANWVSGGNLIARDKLSLLGIKPLYDRYITHGYITKLWCIVGFPVHYDTNFTQAIRTEMFKICPTVKTVISTVNYPANVNPNSDIFKRQLKRAATGYTQYKEIFEGLSEDEQLTGSVEYDRNGRRSYVSADILNKIKDLYDSYTYVFDSATHNIEFTESYIFIQASALNKSDIRKYRKSLNKFMVGEGISFIELKGNINQYLNNYCPASYEHEPIKKISNVLLSQDNLAAITNYKSKGLVGDKGVLFATDWQTKLPFMLDFFHSGAAQVIMVLAKSGWGKTYIMFNAALGLMGYKETHCSAIDIKGNEWVKLLKLGIRGQVIDMDKGVFVNTLRLDNLEVTSEDCAEFFSLAVKDTVQFYKLVVNLLPSEGNEKDLEDILNAAVMKMYYKRGVVASNPQTFIKTSDMHYDEIVTIINSLESAASYTPEQKKLCAVIKTRCASFFLSESGKGSELLKEITVQDILDAPLTIYSFNKNSNALLDLLDSLRVFMVQTLDNRVAMIRKRKGLFTGVFYEELQRCINSPELIRYISSRVTGSRSDNLIIFLLLNAIETFSDEGLNHIKSNITSYIIGRVIDEDAEIIKKSFNCSDIADYIDCVNSEKTEFYRNCFAVKFDTGYKVDKAIIKACVSEEMSTIMATRDVITDEKT